MAFFKQSSKRLRRVFLLSLSVSLALATSAGCGGTAQDPPDAAGGASMADARVTTGSGGSAGQAGTGGAGTGGSGGGSGGVSGSGGAAGASGSAIDAGRGGNPMDGGAGAAGADARADIGRTDGGRDGDGGEACLANTDCPTGHCVGGVCCATACTTPGTCEKLEGVTCPGGSVCRYLKAADDTVCDDGNACTNNVCFQGGCVFKSNKDCNDNDQCTNDICTPSTGACVHEPLNVPVACDDGNPCTNDTCSASAGCQHSDNNAAACTDNNACTDDVCSAGVCLSTPKNCTSLNNDCNVGVCVNGACQAQPANANGACDEGLVSCDATGKCDSAGHCVGNADACGTLSTACAPCTTEPGCYSGRLCTCQAGATPPIVLVNGRCVPGADECNANPCVPVATCSDPTPDGSTNGDVICTCPGGYTGNGKVAGTGCTDIDECNGQNPCGVGSAPGGCNGTSPPGSYTCTCAAGYRSIPTSTGPTCACDLSGTYALSVKTMVGWDAVVVLGIKAIEESPPGGVETYRWALRHQTVETNGSVTVKTFPCGGTAPDACDLAYGYTHAQYQPNHVWGKSKINAGTTSVNTSLVGVIPGGTYVEPQIAELLGITLTDPFGAWPPCRACVGVEAGSTCSCGGTSHTVTNKATWVDVDDDSNLGITNLHVPRGGVIIDSVVPDPPYAYTEPTACPRIATPQGTFTYQEWPGTVGLSTFRTNRFFVGTRMTSGLSGSTIAFANNACTISGTVTGPNSGKTRVEQRTQGCETCSPGNGNACDPGPACTPAQIDSYDDVAQTQRVEAETFTLTKAVNIDLAPIIAMPEGAAKDNAFNAACNEVREQFCPTGKNCNTPP
jgi:hypothetical protein